MRKSWLIGFRFDDATVSDLEKLAELIAKGNKSEAVRIAIREALERHGRIWSVTETDPLTGGVSGD